MSYGIGVEGSLTISGDGMISNYMQLENTNIGSYGGNVGIWTLDDITILSGTIIEKVGGVGISCGGTYRQNGGNVSTSGNNGGLFSESNVLIQSGKLYVSNNYYEALAAYGGVSISGDSLLVCESKRPPALVSSYNDSTGMTVIAGETESKAKQISVLPTDGKYKYIAVYPQAYSTNRFLDVNNTDWFYDSVGYAYNSAITSGTSTVRFSPDLSCTRGQIMQMLWRASGSPKPTTTKNPFRDVKSDDYFCDAVLWAVEKGITNGTSPTSFGPDNICTRGQAMTFLWNAVGRPSASNTISFTDVKSNDYYYN